MDALIMKGDKLIGSNVRVANSFFKRFKGLLGKKSLSVGEGVLLNPCRQVHTWFMKFPIDVIFINKQGRIIHLISGMQPGNVSPYIKRSYQVLELPDGVITTNKLTKKDELSILFIKN